jgi:cytochrome P450
MARYAEVQAALNAWQTFISGAGAGIQDLRTGNAWRPRSIVLEVDPPLHDETRAVLARVLSGPAIKKLRQAFEAEAERLVEDLVSRGTFDAVDDLAMVYPLKVMGDAVGVPPEGRECRHFPSIHRRVRARGEAAVRPVRTCFVVAGRLWRADLSGGGRRPDQP